MLFGSVPFSTQFTRRYDVQIRVKNFSTRRLHFCFINIICFVQKEGKNSVWIRGKRNGAENADFTLKFNVVFTRKRRICFGGMLTAKTAIQPLHVVLTCRIYVQKFYVEMERLKFLTRRESASNIITKISFERKNLSL